MQHEQKFQSTPACGERPVTDSRVQDVKRRFNPRPRVASDAHTGHCRACRCVSIHARVWRATMANAIGTPVWKFQSTPACGERPLQHQTSS